MHCGEPMPMSHWSTDACTTSSSHYCIRSRVRFSAPSDIAAPIRQLEVKQQNVSVMMAEVTGVLT